MKAYNDRKEERGEIGMRMPVLEELGKAAYKARCEELITGAYPRIAIRVPDQEHFYPWDEIPLAIEDAVKWLYRKEGQAAVEAFFAAIVLHGSPDARNTLHLLLKEMKAVLFTDEEQAEINVAEDYQCSTIIEPLERPGQAQSVGREIATLGSVLRQLPSSTQVRPTEALYLLLGQHDWLSSEQAQNLVAKSRNVELGWDAYVVSEGQEAGIYLFGPGGQAHCAFELSQ
jgi:hypothetical protein